MDSLKKRYKSIPVEERLPIGTVEPDETEDLSSVEKECEAVNKQLSDNNQNQLIEQISNRESNTPQIFDPILVPIEESLPSCGPIPSDVVYIAQCKDNVIKARAERNDALKLAKHYRDVAENNKKEMLCLQQNMESRIRSIEQDSASCVQNIRNFWRNQIIEGSSRAGRIVRASLLRK